MVQILETSSVGVLSLLLHAIVQHYSVLLLRGMFCLFCLVQQFLLSFYLERYFYVTKNHVPGTEWLFNLGKYIHVKPYLLRMLTAERNLLNILRLSCEYLRGQMTCVFLRILKLAYFSNMRIF